MKLIEIWNQLGKQPLCVTQNKDAVVFINGKEHSVTNIRYKNGEFIGFEAESKSETEDDLNASLQDLYDLCFSIMGMVPDEDEVDDKWNELFAEIANVINDFYNLGTEDGIVPKLVNSEKEGENE